MADNQEKINSVQSKKELKKELAGKIETVLSELRNKLGEEEFQHRIKKAAKILTRGLHNKDFTGVSKKARPIVNTTGKPAPKKIKGLKKAKAKRPAAAGK